MKLLCEACQRLLPPAAWEVVDGALHVTCAGCGAVSAAAPANVAVAARVPPPVSGARTPGEPPPVSGGLTPGAAPRVTDANTPGEAPPVSAPDTEREPTPAAPPSPGAPWLDAEWAALEARWNDPEAHRRLLARADALDGLPALGRRYKDRLDATPGDAAALRARDELLKRAAAKLLVAPVRAEARPRAKNVVAATVLLTAVGLLVVLLVQLVRTAGAP